MKKTKKKATKKKAKYRWADVGTLGSMGYGDARWGYWAAYWTAKAVALQIEEVRARFR